MSTTSSNEGRVAEVHEFLDRWHQAAADGDFDAYLAAMAEDAHWLGTDATENWDKASFAAFAKPVFEKKQAWDFTAVERNVYINGTGTIAWFDEVLDTWMKGCRGSGVLERSQVGEAPRWQIHHYVLSMTIPNGTGKDELYSEVLPFKAKYEGAMLAAMRKKSKRN